MKVCFKPSQTNGALELFFTMKCSKQPALACPFDAIGASPCPMVPFSGFYESHKSPSSGDARGIVVPLHRNGHQNGQQSRYMLHNCCVDDALAAAEAIRSE